MCDIVAPSNGSHRETSLRPACGRLCPTTRAPPMRFVGTWAQRNSTKTVFWVIADVTAGRLTYGRGNPCDSQEQVYEFG